MIGNSNKKIGGFTECLRRQTFSGMSKAGEAPEDGRLWLRCLASSFLTSARARPLTRHLQIDDRLNLQVLSHVVAGRTPPWAIPQGLLFCRTTFLAAFTGEIVTACQKKKSLYVSESIYEAPTSICACVLTAARSAVCCSQLSPGL